METLLNAVLIIINNTMEYLRLFIICGTAFFIAINYVLKVISNDNNQKTIYNRKIDYTIMAGICALAIVQLVCWILGHFR